jgi:bacteriocin biosynthesis cyclodehydratase domain-containing protein
MTPLPSLPYLAPWYRVAGEPGKVVLEYGQRIVCLEGGAVDALVPALLPLLDGARTIDEIVTGLGEAARPAIEHVLGELADHGLLEAGPPLPEALALPVRGAAGLLAALRPGAAPVAETAMKLESSTVAIVGRGGGGMEAARLLRSSGITVEWPQELAAGVDLALAAPSPDELPKLPGWNAQALEARQPWLQVLPFDGRYSAVGPLYLPRDTCCYECFRLRRAANLGAPEELALLDQTSAAYPSAPALDAIAGGLAAELALQWLVLHDHFGPAAVYALEPFPTLRLTVHHVHRVPRCRVCSGLDDVAAPLPWFKEVPVAVG